tara:strand:- start:437 stop:823 length:387 start_codon:yes stop_codon:yes gene_type:complete
MKINIEVSIGELIDKLSILEIKLEKIDDKEKILNIEKEYKLLKIEYEKIAKTHSDITNYFEKIKIINLEIWTMEEDIRHLIKLEKFGSDYIDIARKIQRKNDHRFEVKNDINKVFNSNLLEQKSYPKY